MLIYQYFFIILRILVITQTVLVLSGKFTSQPHIKLLIDTLPKRTLFKYLYADKGYNSIKLKTRLLIKTVSFFLRLSHALGTFTIQIFNVRLSFESIAD